MGRHRPAVHRRTGRGRDERGRAARGPPPDRRARRGRLADVARAGFDDSDFADLLALPLIVVSYDAREIGRVAAELVCGHIDEPAADASPARRVVIPTRVIDYRNA
jgi:DNA-binding LacI/PurR family transcriptional regulator